MKVRTVTLNESSQGRTTPTAADEADEAGEAGEAEEGTARRERIRPRRPGVTLLKAVVSLALILWILRGTSLGEIFTAIGSADLGLVALSFALYLVGWTISVTRWRILLAAQQVPARFGYLLQSYLVAVFFNNLLPSTIGGDTIRVYDSWRLGRRKTDAVTVIFVDRFLGMLALLAFALVATLGMRWLPQSPPLLPAWIVLAAGGFVALSWLLFLPPAHLSGGLGRLSRAVPAAVGTRITRVAEALSVFRENRVALGKALGLSLVLQLNVILHYYLIAAALGLDVPAFAFFLIVPIALALMAIPVSINAIGIRESVFAFFLGMFGIATVQAVAFAWVAYALVLSQGMVGGVVYALRR